jgi:replicative DNA helicase
MSKPAKVAKTAPDRLPPHSIEAEQGVLGCILMSPQDCMSTVVEKITDRAQVFYDLRHQTIYTELLTMWDARTPIDLIVLMQRLKDGGKLEEIGGFSYLNELQDTVPSAANLIYYLDIVMEKDVLRRMISTCTDVVSRAYEHEGDVEMLLDTVERDVLALAESRHVTAQKSVKTLVQGAITLVEKYFERQGQINGLPTGFEDLDRLTDGLHAGEMIVLAARPSMGKTSLAMNIAEHVVLRSWVEETEDEAVAAAARARGLKVEEVWQQQV